MLTNPVKPQPTLELIAGRILRLALCAVALTAWLSGSNPAAAMGGFGRGGGFGRPGVGMGFGQRRPIIAPRRSGGRVVEPGRGPGHHGIVGGGVGGGIGVNPGPVISGQGPGGGGGGNSRSGVPPQGERRFVPDEVITEISPAATPQSIGQIARRYDLTQLEVQRFPLIGATFYRWRLGGRRSVADTVGALEDERVVMSAQPNYIFSLQEAVTKSASGTQGDAAQYVLEKLQIDRAHQIATGKNVLAAVIDSEIDAKNPNLEHSIVKSFDALSGDQTPHQHGTAMAGAIAAHGKLLGIAPGAGLLAARAFEGAQGEARGMSFAIYKSLQWAADNAARIVNLSFAGPADPVLHRMLAAAHDKNMVLIAAAGNAGPNSGPLYPAADQAVIAVTATDNDDGVFKMANRGAYVAAAAPGVEVLALAPGESYQITTGTSVAAAHVSGVAALLLERKPSLEPDEIRTIITTTAKPFGPASPHAESGAGLVNAYRALLSLNGKAGKDGDEQARR
jgi:subtilisin family serine protease